MSFPIYNKYLKIKKQNMADLIQLRRDTYDNWYFYNPVLAEGEVGIITHASGSGSSTPLSTLQCVVGDGSTPFRDLEKQAWATDNTAYVMCNTLADTAAKGVLIPGFILDNTIRVLIKMENANTAANPTLNISATGAKPIVYNGTVASATGSWAPGEVLDIYYDGTSYVANTHGDAQFSTREKVGDVGIDSVPTANSSNLVESGGVYEAIMDVSGSAAADILELQQSVFPLTVTFTNNAASPSEYTGTAITPTLTWTSTRSGSPITPTEVKIKQGSTVLVTQTPATNTGTYVASVNAIGATTFTAEVTAAGMVKSANTTINQVLPCYVGFYTPGATVNTMKGSLTKKVISGVTGISGTYSNDNATKYLTICIPDTMTIHHIKSSGFDVPMQAVATDTSMKVGGTTRTYKVYRSASPFNVTSVAIVVD